MVLALQPPSVKPHLSIITINLGDDIYTYITPTISSINTRFNTNDANYIYETNNGPPTWKTCSNIHVQKLVSLGM